jgi:hypothetical protein
MMVVQVREFIVVRQGQSWTVKATRPHLVNLVNFEARDSGTASDRVALPVARVPL